MPLTNSWLVTYAIAQLGKPYKMNAYGQEAISDRKKFGSGLNAGDNPYYGKRVKIHDCSGLVFAATCCDTLSSAPDPTKTPVIHFAQSQYSTNCSTKGAISSDVLPMLPPGTLVFKGSPNNIYHVGIYVGPISWKGTSYQYGVVEAMGSDYGVTISNAANWNYWGQLDCCEVNTSSTNMTMISVSSGAYGNLNETPSTANQNQSSVLTTGETISNVEWVQTGTDDWGNPIGYSYTTGANFTPFIATVAPNVNKVDYDALIKAKVSGMMFCAGWLYNNYTAGHTPRKEYVNPHLEKQVVECQANGLPYALYAIVRAKTRIEADAECKRLYYVISKYPPALGLWLFLDMHNSPKGKNEEILDCYYKYIVDWGLSAKCGLYVDSSRLLQIDWNKYQYKFYLWLSDHITDQHTLDTINDEVLKSSFFEVE